MTTLKALVALLLLSSPIAASAQGYDWAPVEKVFGRTGARIGEMFKVTFQRSDVRVKVGKVALEPGLAFTTWVAFMPMSTDATHGASGHDGAAAAYMMMGDLVLLEREVQPVMSALVARGLGVTALHNHLVGESPGIKYVHFSGEGDPLALSKAMMAVIATTSTPTSAPPAAPELALDWRSVESVIGRSGTRRGRLLQFSIPRAETLTERGMPLPPFMGMATAINLQMVGRVVSTTGDFVLMAEEVAPVVRALTENGIAVTAIHNHMLFESPRLFMLHFWASGDGETIAKGLRAALDRTNSLPAR
jgi:hypothetical protein